MTENQQAYIISKVFEYIKREPDIIKDEMRYWNINSAKMIRSFVIGDKKYIQILSQDEETIHLSFCVDGFSVRFFRSELSIEQIDRLL